jgi:hypothetical protein
MADHVLGLIQPADEHARAVRGVFATRCSSDGWSEPIRACVATSTVEVSQHCRERMTAAQLTALDRDLAAAAKQFFELPPPCADYKSLLVLSGRCKDFPADVLASLTAKIAEHEKLWADRDLGEVAAECASASQAVISVAPSCFGK